MAQRGSRGSGERVPGRTLTPTPPTSTTAQSERRAPGQRLVNSRAMAVVVARSTSPSCQATVTASTAFST